MTTKKTKRTAKGKPKATRPKKSLPKTLGAIHPVLPELHPGELEPKDIGDKCRADAFCKALARHIRLPDGKDDPPAIKRLMDLLAPFWQGDYAAQIWELYKRWTRPKTENLPLIDAQAKAVGMTRREYIYTAAYDQIRDYIVARPPLLAVVESASKAADVVPDQEQDHKPSMQVPWDKDNPAYIFHTPALKAYNKAKQENKEFAWLRKILDAGIPVHYMKKGQRGKVHEREFTRWTEGGPITDQAMFDYLDKAADERQTIFREKQARGEKRPKT